MKRKTKTDFRLIQGGQEQKRLSVAHCRNLLKEESNKLSDKDVLEIRDFFYRLAAIAMEDYQSEKPIETPAFNLEQYRLIQHEKESNYLRAS